MIFHAQFVIYVLRYDKEVSENIIKFGIVQILINVIANSPLQCKKFTNLVVVFTFRSI